MKRSIESFESVKRVRVGNDHHPTTMRKRVMESSLSSFEESKRFRLEGGEEYEWLLSECAERVRALERRIVEVETEMERFSELGELKTTRGLDLEAWDRIGRLHKEIDRRAALQKELRSLHEFVASYESGPRPAYRVFMDVAYA